MRSRHLIRLLLVVALWLSGSQVLWLTAISPVRAEAGDTALSKNVQFVEQIGGALQAIAVQGDYAYVGIGPRLVIFNISNPAHPVIAGQSVPLQGIVRDVAVQGAYAYVVEHPEGHEDQWRRMGGSLHVFDISDPAHVIELGFYDTPAYPTCVAVLGNLAYVGDAPVYDQGQVVVGGLRIINVSNPKHLLMVGSYTLPGEPGAIATAEGYVYIAEFPPPWGGEAAKSGLRIIDATSPTLPTALSFYEMPGAPVDIAVQGNCAYVVDGDGVRIIAISDPAHPTEVSFYDSPLYARSIAVKNRYAYVGSWSGFEVIDISDPTQPMQISFCSSPTCEASALNLAIAGSYVYAVGSDRFSIIDVSDPAQPSVIGFHKILGSTSSVAVAGNIAYIAGTGGLGAFDVSDPWQPQALGLCRLQLGEAHVAVANNHAYVVSGDTFYIVDIADPRSMTVYSSSTGFSNALDVVLVGTYAYIADEWVGLLIWDVSDPAHPTQIGFYDTPGRPCAVYVSGGYAYVADAHTWWGTPAPGGLLILDVSDPRNPVEAGFLDLPGWIQDVEVAGRYAYVATGSTGLRVVDVLDPAHPVEIGYYDTTWAYGATVAGSLAYVADDGAGLRIISVTDPVHPKEVGFYDTPGLALQVATDGGRVFVVDQCGGLLILQPEWGRLQRPQLEPASAITGNVNAIAVEGRLAYVGDGRRLLIVDISDVGRPTVVGETQELPGDVYDVAVVSPYAYVAVIRDGIHVIDVSHPTNPQRVGAYDSPGWAIALAVSGHYAYLADGYSGLRVVDISNPAQPREVGFDNVTKFALDLVVGGTYAYVADNGIWDGSALSGGGFRLFNISDPTHPIQIGFYDTGGSCSNVAQQGTLAFARVAHGIRILDISNVANPIPIGTYSPTVIGMWGINRLTAHGGYIYVTLAEAGVRVVDVSTSEGPSEVATYDTPGAAWDVVLAGSYLYVADRTGGLQILRLLRDKVVTSIPPSGGMLTSTTQDTVLFSSGAFIATVDLTYRRLWADQDTGTLVGIGRIFDLSAVYSDTGQVAQLAPEQSFTVALHYTDRELGSVREDILALYAWDGSAWVREPTSVLDAGANTISATPNHLGLFAVLGETHRLYLPVVMKRYGAH